MNGKMNRKDGIYIVVNIFITLVAVFAVYGLWKRDFSVPITYNNDGIGALVMFKKAAIGEKLSCFNYFQAPYGQEVYSQDFLFSYFFVKIIMLFTEDVGIGVNIYWLLTYVLTAITCYYFLRKTGCGYIIAVVGSVIYNFLPYHYFRLEHFWLMGCFTIPLVGCLTLELLNTREKKNKKERILSNVWIASFCLVIGLTGIYYAFFSIIVLGITMLYVLIGRKKILYLGKFLYDVFMIVLPIAIFVALPSIFGNSNTVNSISLGRNIGQINVYGLNILLMLLPIPGHRIKVLSDLTEHVYEQTNIYTEAFTAHLGLIMVVGLIASVMYLFKERCEEEWQVRIKQFGFLNVVIILFATVGGLDNFVGIFVTDMVRCYNRMSVFIGLFSVAAFSVAMEQIYSKIAIKQIWVKNLSCMLIATIAVLDQTSTCFASYETYNPIEREYVFSYDSVREQYEADMDYLNQVYELLDHEKMVYIEPIERVITSENADKQFHRLKLYLNDISSEYMEILDEKYRDWLRDLEKGDMETRVQALSILGFSGILLDKNAFPDEDSFESVCLALEEYLDDDVIISSDERLFFYSFKEWKKEYLSTFSESEINELRQAIKEDIYNSYEKVDKNEIYNIDENGVLEKNNIQFGPYVELEKGEYQVLVLGENLSDSGIKVTAERGKREIEVLDESVNKDYIEYRFELPERTSDVEFTLINHSNDIRINSYFYRETSDNESSFYEAMKRHAELMEKIELGSYVENISFALLKTKGKACLYSDEILLEKDALQYGPYIGLSEGSYEVIIKGDNLKLVMPSVTSGCGKKTYDLQVTYRGDESLVYEFNVEDMADQFEFLLQNRGEDTVHIYNYSLKKQVMY